MPLDHFAIYVPQSKFEDLVAFLTTSLSHLGFKEITRPFPTLVGLGETTSYFWMSGLAEDVEEKTLSAILKKDHIAFTAENSEQVKQFHAAALKAGATCNGPPGLRPHYGLPYYGAFVLDPACGINFEVVCRTGE